MRTAQTTLSLFTSTLLLNLAVTGLANASPESLLSIETDKSAFSPYLLAQTTEKPRIAVLDFDYSSISNPRWYLWYDDNASGVSDILVNKLVESGKYSVIERSRLDAILQEQNLGTSGRIDPTTAAQVGKILGVDFVILGSVTQFDLQQKQSGGSFLFGIGGSSTKTDAYVTLNVRMVNTTTAEIISVAEGKGTANQSDSQVRVLGIGGGSSTSNEGRLLTLATEKAIGEVLNSLAADAGQIATAPKAVPSVNALVAAILGNQVVLNKGSADGYRPGLQVSIERVAQEIKDPATGEVLRQLTQPLGVIELVEVDERSSVGRIVSGTQFKVGDVAKPTQ